MGLQCRSGNLSPPLRLVNSFFDFLEILFSDLRHSVNFASLLTSVSFSGASLALCLIRRSLSTTFFQKTVSAFTELSTVNRFTVPSHALSVYDGVCVTTSWRFRVPQRRKRVMHPADDTVNAFLLFFTSFFILSQNSSSVHPIKQLKHRLFLITCSTLRSRVSRVCLTNALHSSFLSGRNPLRRLVRCLKSPEPHRRICRTFFILHTEAGCILFSYVFSGLLPW